MLPQRRVGRGLVEGDAQVDLDVPSGDADFLGEQPQELLFLRVSARAAGVTACSGPTRSTSHDGTVPRSSLRTSKTTPVLKPMLAVGCPSSTSVGTRSRRHSSQQRLRASRFGCEPTR